MFRNNEKHVFKHGLGNKRVLKHNEFCGNSDSLYIVTNETQTVFDELFWTNRTAVLDRPLDAFGRPAGLSLKIDGDFAQSICYDYGVDGHLSGMALTNAQGRSVSVEYDWEQGRFVGSTVFDSSGDPIFARTVSRAPRRPALVTAITNAGIQPLTSNLSSRTFSYAYDAVGRPVERGADAFAYNARGEVTNATISGATWGYAYDHIGNREAATAPSGTTAYAANALNQYAAVTGRSVAHDADGNMTRNGERNQTWDAAGRLVKSSPDLVQRWQTWQDFDYDYRGRRTAKYTQIFFGGIAPPVDTHLYFYDDWNLVHETTISETYQIKHVDYFWGPDLSGTLQGAGGVGGLVAVSIDGFFYFPGYDNNGNVIGYWDESGSLVAEYSYDAFGNTISSSGSMASVFPHRFSTKYYDAETDLYYYGYRYYSPSIGRWISRDPIEEKGGFNLFQTCCNNMISHIDSRGMKIIILDFAENNSAPSPSEKLAIEKGNKRAKKLVDFLSTKVSDVVFDRAVLDGKVTVDGQPFQGKRSEYIAIARHEMQSKYLPFGVISFEDALEKVKLYSRTLKFDFDVLAVEAHGFLETVRPLLEFDPDTGEELHATTTPMMMFAKGGSREASLASKQLSEARAGAIGKVVVAACFQTAGKDDSADVATKRKESLHVTPAFENHQPYKAKTLADKTEVVVELCGLEFDRFKIERTVGGEGNEHDFFEEY